MSFEKRFEGVEGTELIIKKVEECIDEGLVQIETLVEDESTREGLKIFGEEKPLSPQIIEKLRVDRNMEIAES